MSEPVMSYTSGVQPSFEVARTDRVVSISIGFTDEFAAIDFYQAMLAGVQAGVLEFRMTVPPEHDGGFRPMRELG